MKRPYGTFYLGRLVTARDDEGDDQIGRVIAESPLKRKVTVLFMDESVAIRDYDDITLYEGEEVGP